MSEPCYVCIVPDRPVIGGKDHHGFGLELLLLQCFQNPADLGIHHAAEFSVHSGASLSLELARGKPGGMRRGVSEVEKERLGVRG